MKKWLSLGLAALLVLCGLASCAKKNSDYFNFTYSDYLTLGEYKGVTVAADDLDDAVDSAKESIISANTTTDEVTDRGAQDKDILTVSYTVSIDGEEVDALKKTDYSVTLGTTALDFSEIKDMLTGMTKDEEKTGTIQIPDYYKVDGAVADYAGKEAQVKLTLTKIQQKNAPAEVTDEMVAKYTNDEYKTQDEYYAYVRSEKKKDLAWNAVMKNITILKYPETETKLYYNMYLNRIANSISSSGMTMASYASMLGYDSLDKFLEEYLTPLAANTAMQQLAALSIYEKEGLSYTDEAYSEMADQFAEQNSMENGESYVKQYGDTDIVLQLKSNAVYTFVADNAVEDADHTHEEDTSADTTAESSAETTADTAAGTAEESSAD